MCEKFTDINDEGDLYDAGDVYIGVTATSTMVIKVRDNDGDCFVESGVLETRNNGAFKLTNDELMAIYFAIRKAINAGVSVENF